MSLLTNLLKSLFSKGDSTDQNQGEVLLTAALSMLDQMGGIQGLMNKFKQSGLDDLVLSWIGTGENKAVTPDQISNALGRDDLEILTRQANIPTGQGGSILAQLLPALVDKLTPDGQIPEQGQLLTAGKSILSGLLASGLLGGKGSPTSNA